MSSRRHACLRVTACYQRTSTKSLALVFGCCSRRPLPARDSGVCMYGVQRSCAGDACTCWAREAWRAGEGAPATSRVGSIVEAKRQRVHCQGEATVGSICRGEATVGSIVGAKRQWGYAAATRAPPTEAGSPRVQGSQSLSYSTVHTYVERAHEERRAYPAPPRTRRSADTTAGGTRRPLVSDLRPPSPHPAPSFYHRPIAHGRPPRSGRLQIWPRPVRRRDAEGAAPGGGGPGE